MVANLVGSMFSSVEITNGNFTGADLSGAFIKEVKFIDSDLNDAVFDNGYLAIVSFGGSKLAGATFHETHFFKLDLTHADFWH